MISSLLYLLYLSAPVKPPQVHKNAEICPGATYFIVHGHYASWMKKEKLLCSIGKHDFYGD